MSENNIILPIILEYIHVIQLLFFFIKHHIVIVLLISVKTNLLRSSRMSDGIVCSISLLNLFYCSHHFFSIFFYIIMIMNG